MIRSLPRLLRNGTFRTAAACALALLLAVLATTTFSLANPLPANGATPEEPRDIIIKTDEEPSIKEYELILAGLVLVFWIISMLAIRHLFKGSICKKTETVERITIVTILVMGSLFLITSGYSSSHIAPAFGLFGMIGGYLLSHIVPWRQLRHSEEKMKNESDGNQ